MRRVNYDPVRAKRFKTARARFARKYTSTKSYRGSRSNKLSLYRIKNTVQLGRGFPDRVQETHRYAETLVFSSVAGVLTQQKFITNGMYDPNYTGGGHQPTLFDTFSTLYDHYTVIGSKIKVKVVPTVANTAPIQVGMVLNDDTSNLSLTGDYDTEQIKATPTLLMNSYSDPQELNLTWSAKKTFGGSVLANTSLQGTPSSNPSEYSVFHIWMQTGDGSVSNTSCTMLITIEYIAVWKEFKDQAVS